MERARSAVTNLFGRVPLTYTRFSLTPQTDGDASQVEMKLADDDECGDSTLGEPVIKHRKGNNESRNLCLKILAVILVFFIGFLIGYLSHRGRIADMQNQTKNPTPAQTQVDLPKEEEDGEETYSEENPNVLYWSDVKPMLDKRIELINFENNIRKMWSLTRDAGTSIGESLADVMDNEFTKMGLDKVWSDEHYVTLQDKGSSNKVQLLKSGIEKDFKLSSYVAYSATGSVDGSLVYGHYGRPEDFDALRVKNINVTGVLILLRSGQISFSEKVRNAELAKAAGVLIYPDPSDFTFPSEADQEIESPFGHAHFGTGDPFTPGFPSFNHTQFPPSRSSGLPGIPVQTLSSSDGKILLGQLDTVCKTDWGVGCKLKDQYTVKLEVNNTLAEKKILNVFGVIKGVEDPDRYVVIGAQRESWKVGVAKTVVGSSILLEVARVITQMIKEDQYKPKRSIVFASWSAGDFGAVGATEWLEGYLSTLHLKTISYISLDDAIQGAGPLQVSGSPLMYTMILKTLKEVSDPNSNGDRKLSDNRMPAKNLIQPLSMADAAYPFIAYSGVPSVSFSFKKDNKFYAYLGTTKDSFENFQSLVHVDTMCRAVANLAAQLILRLTHDHKLPLDFVKYKEALRDVSIALSDKKADVNGLGLTLDWINYASGDFGRAAGTLKNSFDATDPENKPYLRSLNDRVMKVEHSLLSPYVSPKDSPFRHILYGNGNHTVNALMKHLNLLKDESLFDKDVFKNQLALLTWTIQGAANALGGEIWEIYNEF